MNCSPKMAFFTANYMLQNHHDNDDHESPSSLSPIPPPCASQDFHGVASLLGKRSMSFSGIDMCHDQENNNGEDDLSDDGSQLGEKKRRLNMEQVRTLEKSFESGNKLEPDRKMQLAKALGLQPRQIAIWFQNRRARWKTKKLEKDYDALKRQFDAVKAENHALQTHNQELQSEILAVTAREPTESINLNKETEGSCSNRSQNSSDLKLDISKTLAIDSPLSPTTTDLPLFPPSIRPTTLSQLFQTSSRPDPTVKEETLYNMFCGIDDQTGFLPWLEQQHFS